MPAVFTSKATGGILVRVLNLISSPERIFGNCLNGNTPELTRKMDANAHIAGEIVIGEVNDA